MLSDHHARDLRFEGLGAHAHAPAMAAEQIAEQLRAWAAAHPNARLQQLSFVPWNAVGVAALLAYTDGTPAPEAQQAIEAALEELRTRRPEEPPQLPPSPPPPFV
jgi:hypothetical protein